MIDAPRRTLRLFKNRQTLILLVALMTLMLAPGMRGRLFRARELTDGLPVESPSPITAHLQAAAARSSGPGQPARGPVRTAGLEPSGHQIGPEAGHGRSRYGLEPGVRDGPANSPGDRGRHQALGGGVRIELLPCPGGGGDLCSRPGRRQRSGDLTRVGGRHARFVDGQTTHHPGGDGVRGLTHPPGRRDPDFCPAPVAQHLPHRGITPQGRVMSGLAGGPAKRQVAGHRLAR